MRAVMAGSSQGSIDTTLTSRPRPYQAADAPAVALLVSPAIAPCCRVNRVRGLVLGVGEAGWPADGGEVTLDVVESQPHTAHTVSLPFSIPPSNRPGARASTVRSQVDIMRLWASVQACLAGPAGRERHYWVSCPSCVRPTSRGRMDMRTGFLNSDPIKRHFRARKQVADHASTTNRTATPRGCG